MSEEEKQEKRFQVKDKRRFTEQGEERGEEEEKETAREEAKDREAARAEETRETAELPEINFATFVVSLSSSVLIHLGLAPDPVTGEKKRELSMAKQTIDILAMIKEKTKGNLSKEESQLMESLLYDLRMQYVEEKKKG